MAHKAVSIRARQRGEERRKERRSGVPLVTRLEGENPRMTVLAVTGVALMLILFQFDGDDSWSLVTVPAEVEGWKSSLFGLGVVLLLAGVAAVFTFLALYLNFRPPGSRHWRLWTLVSSVALFLFNIMAFGQWVSGMEKSILGDEQNVSWDSTPAHHLLSWTVLIAALLVDIYYIRLFGCCGCCCCSTRTPKVLIGQKTVEGSLKDEAKERMDSAGTHSVLPRDPGHAERTTDGAIDTVNFNTEQQATPVVVNNMDAAMDNSVQTVVNRLDIQEMMSGARTSAIENRRHFDGDVVAAEPTNMRGKRPQAAMKRWDTTVLAERWGDTATTKVRPTLRRQKASKGDGGVVGAIRKFVSLLNPTVVWRLCYRRLGEAWKAVEEEEGRFHYSVWVKAAVLTSVFFQLYTCVKTVEFWWNGANQWSTFTVAANSRLQDITNFISDISEVIRESLLEFSQATDLGVAEKAANTVGTLETNITRAVNEIAQEAFGISAGGMQLSPSDINGLDGVHVAGNVFFYSADRVNKLVEYVDTLVPILRWCIFFGYPLGTLTGLWTLYTVMAQHKKMFLSLGYEMDLQARNSTSGQPTDPDNWLGVAQKYPIGGAVFFFGVLTSTAVIQLHIFGFFFTVLFGVLVNIKNIGFLWDIFGFWLVALLAVIIFNRLVVVILGNKLLSDGFRISHPQFFFLYMFVFSMTHLVLGILHSIVRLAFLLFTTLFVLNRLDISLFTIMKPLDGGHNAFMSMLVLAQVIQKNKVGNNESGSSGKAKDVPGGGLEEGIVRGEASVDGPALQDRQCIEECSSNQNIPSNNL